MQLGPQNFGPDELYAYSLVSNPTRTFNYVLARDVDDFNEVTTQSLLRSCACLINKCLFNALITVLKEAGRLLGRVCF